MVCTLHGVGDVEHYQHAMTPPRLSLAAEPSAHYQERRRRLFANAWSHAGPVVRIHSPPAHSRTNFELILQRSRGTRCLTFSRGTGGSNRAPSSRESCELAIS